MLKFSIWLSSNIDIRKPSTLISRGSLTKFIVLSQNRASRKNVNNFQKKKNANEIFSDNSGSYMNIWQ